MLFCFPNIVIYILNVASAINQMTVNSFIFENYYKKNRFCQRKHLFFNDTFGKKGLLLIATKLIEKIADPIDAKEYYNSCFKRKDTKPVK